VDLIKGGVEKYGLINPIFKPGPIEPRYSEYLVFEGISVDEFTGNSITWTLIYRRACLNAIEYFKKFGYTGEQICLLLGSAVEVGLWYCRYSERLLHDRCPDCRNLRAQHSSIIGLLSFYYLNLRTHRIKYV